MPSSWRQRAEAAERDNDVADVRSQELEKYSRYLEAEVARRTRSIQMILENVSFGFLLVDRDLKLQDGFSHVCNELFGRRLMVGDDLRELLGLHEESERVALSSAVEQVFDDVLPEELCLAQLPTRFVVDEVVLQLDGRVVRDAAQSVVGLLFNVTDATAIEATRKLSRNRDVLIGILRQKAAFVEFVRDTRDNLEAASDMEASISLRRLVHTIKGNAGAWGLDDVVAAAHVVEAMPELSAQCVEPVRAALEEFLHVNEAVLDMNGALATQRDDSGYSRPPLSTAHVGVVRRPASELLGPIERYAYDIAARLGKTIQVRVSGMHIAIDVERMRPVLRALPHMINNAIDHGIEPPSQRGPKSSLGRLSITLREHADHWELEVGDDGRGVQLDKLAAESRRLGNVSEQHAQGYELMFLDGVTSADHATEVSGRGVGMAALREAVTGCGGHIDVTSGPNGTAVTIRVPMRMG